MTESDEDMFSCYEESGNKPSSDSATPTSLKTESSFEFLTVSELADATPATLPPHNYVRTLGVCGGRNLDVLYLAEVKKPSLATVRANFDCTGTFPAMRSTVEAFGRVDFKRRGATVAPELVVWFFRELCGNSTAYADVCLKLRARRPQK